MLGTIVACIDALHEGPTPAGLSSEGWRIIRARFVAESGWTTFEAAVARMAEIDAALDHAGDHDEVVIWVEHDLLCQLAISTAWRGSGSRS